LAAARTARAANAANAASTQTGAPDRLIKSRKTAGAERIEKSDSPPPKGANSAAGANAANGALGQAGQAGRADRARENPYLAPEPRGGEDGEETGAEAAGANGTNGTNGADDTAKARALRESLGRGLGKGTEGMEGTGPSFSEMRFSYDEEAGRPFFKLIDPVTREVIKQFPPDEFLTMVKRLRDASGSFDEEGGVLVDQRL
jgi:uncharacterized FlaG/YvyC family protein